jgi:hypothetical protein
LRDVIIEAEAVFFDANQEKELVELLWGAVLTMRRRRQQEDLVAMCSAIRKLVACMDVHDMDRLLALVPDSELAPEIELEVVKMAARKFVANPPSLPDTYLLADAAYVIFKASMLDLKDGCRAATAMNALLALSAMRSRHFQPALAAVDASPSWLKELAHRRLELQKAKLEQE